MHAERAKYGTCQRNVLYRTCVFCMYTVWCQLTHLHEHWRHPLAYYRPNDRTLKVFLTNQTVYHETLWNCCTNVRILPDGEIFTRRTMYGNILHLYDNFVKFHESISDKSDRVSWNFTKLSYKCKDITWWGNIHS